MTVSRHASFCWSKSKSTMIMSPPARSLGVPLSLPLQWCYCKPIISTISVSAFQLYRKHASLACHHHPNQHSTAVSQHNTLSGPSCKHHGCSGSKRCLSCVVSKQKCTCHPSRSCAWVTTTCRKHYDIKPTPAGMRHALLLTARSEPSPAQVAKTRHWAAA